MARIVAADAPGLARAAALLRAGRPVAVPTETVYGLAARADDGAAVEAIYQAKQRPAINPLIVHVESSATAERLGCFDERARSLAAAFWPGPLTLVLPLRAEARVAPAVTAGLPTVALRCPAHPVMRALLAATGLPLAAPSANRSGAVSPTCAAHVAASLGAAIELIVDGGACAQGLESTIVALRDEGRWSLLRPGPIGEEAVAALLGMPAVTSGHGIEAPGQLTAHYGPGKPVRLEATEAADDEFLIGFGTVVGAFGLSDAGDLAEASVRLYTALHAAAAATQPRIAVAPIPRCGPGAAINDRLRRAAA